jgi:hypothetical protein
MALTARQRNKLPKSAFAIHPGKARSRWAYPLPTPSQARRAGISEGQRKRMLRAAVTYSARSSTRGSPRTIAPKAKRRNAAAGGSRAWGSTAPRRGQRVRTQGRRRAATTRARRTTPARRSRR